MIVFETPGWLDMEAITTFGLNAKPNSKSPIGYFGTGLKYALAVLLREGCKVAIYRGYDRWDFEIQEKEFRGEQFLNPVAVTPSYFPKMRKRERLPFTLELGKNWKMWQAFRELFSNTLDEAGETYRKDDGWTPPREHARTFILVEGAAFEEEFDKRWETFLEKGTRDKVSGVQILPGQSNFVYYRGVRVMELKKPSLFTYNILEQLELTEDRTARYSFYADQIIRNAIARSDDKAMLHMILNADECWYEHRLDFSDHFYSPSEAFILAGNSCRNVSARKFLRAHNEEWIAAQKAKHFTERLAECITEGEWDKFLDLAQENQDELYKLLMGVRPSSWEPDADMITIDNEGERYEDLVDTALHQQE